MTERFEVHIRARDDASRILGQFNRNLRDTQTTSQRASNAMIAMADKAKWAFAGMSAAIIGATKVYADFDREMAMVSTMVRDEVVPAVDEFGRAIEGTEQSIISVAGRMGEYSDAIRMMSIEYGESTATLSKGLYDVLSAGIDAGEALDVLDVASRAAAAGMTDTGVAADAITSIINAYGMEASQAEDVSDMLFTTVAYGKTTFDELAKSIGPVISSAQVAGVGFEEVAATLATLTRGGLETNIAVTGLRSALAALRDPTEEAREVAAELGFTLDENTTKTMGLVGVIEAMEGATAKQIGTIFRNERAYMAMAAAIGRADEVSEDYARQLERTGATMEAFERATDNLHFQIQQLRQAGLVLVCMLGEALAPTISRLIERIMGVAQSIMDWSEHTRNYVAQAMVMSTAILGIITVTGYAMKAIKGLAVAFGIGTLATGKVGLALVAVGMTILAVTWYIEDLIKWWQKLEDLWEQFEPPKLPGFEHEPWKPREEFMHGPAPPRPIATLAGDISVLSQSMNELENSTHGAQRELHPFWQALVEISQTLKALIAGVGETEEAVAALAGIMGMSDEAAKAWLETMDKGIEDSMKLLSDMDKTLKDIVPSIESLTQVSDDAGKALRGIAYDIEFDLLLSQVSDLDREFLRVQKTFIGTRDQIVSLAEEGIEAQRRLAKEYPELAQQAADRIEEIERDKNRALKTLNLQLYRDMWDALIQHRRQVRAEREAEIAEEEAAARARADAYEQHYRTYLRMTNQHLDLILREFQAKHREILASHDWTFSEMATITGLLTHEMRDAFIRLAEDMIRELENVSVEMESELIRQIEALIERLEEMGWVGEEAANKLREGLAAVGEEARRTTEDIDRMADELLRVVGDIGDILIGVHFGDTPGIGQIGGIFTGLLGIFTSIPALVLNIFTMIFGWIDRIQRRTQEMIDEITKRFQDALVDIFYAPDFDTAFQDFGQRLREITYRMMVEAIVEAFITSQAVQDAAKQWGQAIQQFLRDGCEQALIEAYHNFIAAVEGEVLTFQVIYDVITPHAPPGVIHDPVDTGPVHVGGGFPSYQMGIDYVPRDTWAYLHKGEQVVPEHERGGRIGTVNLTVNNYGERMEGRKLWEEFEFEARRRGIQLARN